MFMKFLNHSKIAKYMSNLSQVKPTFRENQDQIIINVWTNDLASNECPQQIAESIIGVASSLKSDMWSVSLKYNCKTPENTRGKYSFKELFKKKLYYINHEKKSTVKHLNGSKLHLDRKGASILLNTFVESISNALQWCLMLHSFDESRHGSRWSNKYKVNSLSNA